MIAALAILSTLLGISILLNVAWGLALRDVQHATDVMRSAEKLAARAARTSAWPPRRGDV